MLLLLDPPPGQPPWAGGATPLGCLRGVSHEQAAWPPAAGRHSIWEFVLHIAYWKYAVRRKLEGSAKGGFPRKPSDWPRVPDPPNAAAWKRDRALLRDQHRRLVDAVRAFDPRRLDERPPGSRSYRYADLLYGIVTHDTYHVGQIQLVKRLYQSAQG
ncbi:MAG: DinB family protein [Thermoanaerobaculia bacterium]